MDHNHAVSQVRSTVYNITLIKMQELYKHLPQVRKLSKDVKEKAVSLLEMNANKKLIQEAICQETGNVILLKDLTNIASATKKKTTRNDLDAVVKLLMDKYGKYLVCVVADINSCLGACVDVYSDDMKNFKNFKKANMITTELAAVISESSHIHFHRQLNLVKELIKYWKSGEEIALKLTEIDEGTLYVHVCCNNIIVLPRLAWAR